MRQRRRIDDDRTALDPDSHLIECATPERALRESWAADRADTRSDGVVPEGCSPRRPKHTVPCPAARGSGKQAHDVSGASFVPFRAPERADGT
jgi:hypothetical protein